MQFTRLPYGSPLPLRFWNKVHFIDDATSCWEWRAGLHPTGYGTLQIGRGYELAHRISYRLAHGAIPDGAHILHKCDNPACVRPDHLFVGTHADNMRDMAKKGRMNGGHGVKLNPAKVRQIRQLNAEGATQQSLADQFGVALMTINHVIKRRTWKHIK